MLRRLALAVLAPALFACVPELQSRCEKDTDCVGGTCVDGYCKVQGCPDGFKPGASGCVPIEACAAGAHDCAADATCAVVTGGFACACKAGFAGDGKTCSDIDECLSGVDNCSADADCTNTRGGFTCACKSGFLGDGVACSDVDECLSGLDDCAAQANCVNTDGSFTCICKEGFGGDGRSCAALSLVSLGAMRPGAGAKSAGAAYHRSVASFGNGPVGMSAASAGHINLGGTTKAQE